MTFSCRGARLTRETKIIHQGGIKFTREFLKNHQVPGRSKFHQGGQNNSPGRVPPGLWQRGVFTLLTLLRHMHIFPLKKYWEFGSTSRRYSFVDDLAYSRQLYSLKYNTSVTLSVSIASVCACVRIPCVLGPKGVVAGLRLVSVFLSMETLLLFFIFPRGGLWLGCQDLPVGSFSNDGGDGGDDTLWKNEFIFYRQMSQLCKCFQDAYRSKNLPGLTCTDSVQFQKKIPKISHCGSRSPKYTDLGHFTLLFCRGRQRNVP